MGLTTSSTGTNLLNDDIALLKNKCDYTIAIAGNPNVGKSTIFNSLTGMHQHTGNWPGKTVANAAGITKFKDKNFLLVDIPGTYSLMSNSEEEEIARNYICFGDPDATILVLDATCLERNLNLVYQTMEITPNIIVCVNLLDEAKRKGISIDLNRLEKELGVPVVGTIAQKKKTLFNLMKRVDEVCSKRLDISPNLITYSPAIETNINALTEKIKYYIPKSYRYLSRWICLKLLDNDKKIISSINKNIFSFQIQEKENIKAKLDDCMCALTDENISSENFKDDIVSSILKRCENVSKNVCEYKNSNYHKRDRKIDKILTSKTFGIPIMLCFLGLIFWLTISGANYPSMLLSQFFSYLGEKLLLVFNYFSSPEWFTQVCIDGVYRTLTWVISVMLPPMAIFFPLFTLMEDLGYLPRIAFNLDKCFCKCCSSGKQALTMCMGFGCNAAGVIGSRIIDSPREKLLSIITNSFVPCNGRFPFLITIAMVFVGSYASGFTASILSTLTVLLVVLLGIFMTFFITNLLSKTVLKGVPSSFMLELPPYRKPQIGKVLVRSIFDRTLFVLGRAVCVAAHAGLIIWLFANIHIQDISILTYVANFFDPFARLMGLDGYILTAFILGLPANEIVLPIILMSYTSSGYLVDLEDTFSIGQILIQNGWTLLTAINVMIFTLLHFPCSTTLITIKKETKSMKWTVLSFVLPTLCGIVLCMFTNLVWQLFV